MKREHILEEITRTAHENGGVPLGRERLESTMKLLTAHLVLIIGLFGAAPQALAGDDPFPNNTDLHVAYCLAVAQEVATMEKSSYDTATDTQAKAISRAGMEETQAKILRLKRYLVPRLTQANDYVQIAAATAQARQDSATMRAEPMDSPYFACVGQCMEGATFEQGQACINAKCANLAGEAIAHLRRCSTIQSELPY